MCQSRRHIDRNPDGKHKRTLLPFEHRAGVGLLVDAPHHAAVFQGHALQQSVIHVVPDADGEDAELLLHGGAGAAEDRRGPDLPDGRPPVRQENNERHAVRPGVGARQVVAEQGGARLDGPIDVRACSRGTTTLDIVMATKESCW